MGIFYLFFTFVYFTVTFLDGIFICDTNLWFVSDFGPSGVRALPIGVAAERSVHYFWYIFLAI